MSNSRLIEGVFGELANLSVGSFGTDKIVAINKPKSISSAQVVRDLQRHFNTSKLFAPLLALEKARRDKENKFQRKRRKDKRLQVKIGHGGTLDPLATGVLIIGVGKGTKQLGQFLECAKSYEATLLLGAATDTYDILGRLIAKGPYSHVSREMVEVALQGFTGKIMQKPPIFSALRVEGKRFYEYAREGKELPIEIQERPVSVDMLSLTKWLEPGSHDYRLPVEEAEQNEKVLARKFLHLEENGIDDEAKESSGVGSSQKRKRSAEEEEGVGGSGGLPPTKRSLNDPQIGNTASEDSTANGIEPSVKDQAPHGLDPGPPQGPPAIVLNMTVTSGFYVRSLCHDLGKSLGSLGIMSDLIRTRQAEFQLGRNVLAYDDLAKGEETWGPIVEAMLQDLKANPTVD